MRNPEPQFSRAPGLAEDDDLPDGVLYFPYMRVPSSAWFTRVLLYWDEIGCIVPSVYGHDRQKLGDYGNELTSAGLLKTIHPDAFSLPGLADGFIRALDAEGRARPGRETYGVDAGPGMDLHIAKMGREIARALQERGLAQPVKRSDAGWYAVEPRTADLFMAYLAVSSAMQRV